MTHGVCHTPLRIYRLYTNFSIIIQRHARDFTSDIAVKEYYWNMSSFILGLGCALIAVSLAYPQGAGFKACDNYLLPKHSQDSSGQQILGQNSESPYQVTVDFKSEDGYIISEGEEVAGKNSIILFS